MSKREQVARLYEVSTPVQPEASRHNAAKSLDRNYYLASNSDVRSAGVDPQRHYLSHGIKEGRMPSAWFSPAYVRNQLKLSHLDEAELLECYQASDLPDRPRILFVGHEASRTGAPAIILRLIELFCRSDSVECITILDEGGERLQDFQAASHVYVMSRSRREGAFDDAELFVELEDLFGEHGGLFDNPPVIALVNSAESVRIARVLHRLNIPIVSLIHEFASFYDPSVFADFSAISEKLIVPSQIIQQTALDHAALDKAKLTVRGQGLLDDGFGSLSKQACRAMLRKRLGLPDNAFIVLNVGTLELRKGIDSFARAACLFCEQYREHEHVYFLWYGGEPAAPESALGFAEREIAVNGFEDRIRFLPSTPHIEPIFCAADLFFLTARADPFPCVVHEAFACALPVIAFRNGGGAQELIGDDCGTLVDMGDYAAASGAIHSYLDRPEMLEAHGANALCKIREHWKFADYYAFVRNEMQNIVGPVIGPPAVQLPDAEQHLVLSAGDANALGALKCLDPEYARTQIILTSQIPDASTKLRPIVDQLIQNGAKVEISNSTQEDVQATMNVLWHAVQKVRPTLLTVIDVAQVLDPELLQVLACGKRLILTGMDIDSWSLYRVGLHFDEIYTNDPSLYDRMSELNPLIAQRVSLLPSR